MAAISIYKRELTPMYISLILVYKPYSHVYKPYSHIRSFLMYIRAFFIWVYEYKTSNRRYIHEYND